MCGGLVIRFCLSCEILLLYLMEVWVCEVFMGRDWVEKDMGGWEVWVKICVEGCNLSLLYGFI